VTITSVVRISARKLLDVHINCETYESTICKDKIVEKESVQGGKSLSKEAFDNGFLGMWLHLELVYGVNGGCLQL
jgi:hypothetical protein